jgi:hypothetical protein
MGVVSPVGRVCQRLGAEEREGSDQDRDLAGNVTRCQVHGGVKDGSRQL